MRANVGIHTSIQPCLVITVIDHEKQVFALGADDFLIKPVDRLPLLNKLNTLAKQGKIQMFLLIDNAPAYRYVVKQLKQRPLKHWHFPTSRHTESKPDLF